MTKPEYPRLLDRQAAEKRIKQDMGSAYGLLLEELKWGIALLDRCAATMPDTRMKDSGLRLLWLYLEQLDAVDALIRTGLLEAAHSQARSLLDVALQLLYLLSKNDERIAMAFTTHRRRQYLRDAKRMVLGGQQRKEIEAEAQRTKQVPPDFVSRFPDTSDEVKRLSKSLEGSLWKEANDDLAARKDPDRWFAAFEGPRTLKDVARQVGMELWHRLIYAPWSAVTHGNRSQRVFVPTSDGKLIMRQFRDSDDWTTILLICHGLNMEIFTEVIARFRPGEEKAYARWYIQTLKPMMDDSPLGPVDAGGP